MERQATDVGGSPLAAAAAVAPAVRAAADRTEGLRRLPDDLVAVLGEAGLFALCLPAGLGGAEADPATFVSAVEEVSRADGSAGWCVAIAATSGVLAAYLPEAAAREIYGSDPSAPTGGVFAPSGKAEPEDGGWRVTGRWRFASGCTHCAWLMGGSVVMSDGTPVSLPSGAPDSRLMLFPASEAEIIDTWDVAGLCGTGSHDIAVSDVFVPHARSVSLYTDAPVQTGALYAFPVFGLLAIGIASVALGIARGAIDDLTELASGKTPTGSRRTLGERAAVQSDVATAVALVRSGRAFLLDTIGDAWTQARSDGTIGVEHRGALRLAATHAVRSSARAVDLMYEAGGGTSVYRSCSLQRRFRDVHAAAQHMMVAPPTLELTGRILLGLTTETWGL